MTTREDADTLITLGRELLGDEWADKVEERSVVTFSATSAGLVCDRCGVLAGRQKVHIDYHRLLNAGISYAEATAALVHREMIRHGGDQPEQTTEEELIRSQYRTGEGPMGVGGVGGDDTDA